MDAQPLNRGDAPVPPPALVRPWIWSLLAAVLTLATYLPALAGEFVWDDTQLIQQTPQTSSGRSIADYFTKPFWEPNSIAPEMSLYYRPLVALSYDLDHELHGLNSAGYRITNYSFHVANVILLFLLARRFGASGVTAALLSAAWGVLPRLSESVAWISGRTDVLAAAFILAALLLWAERWSRKAAAAVCLLLGLFCKETALAGLVVLVCLEVSESKYKLRTLPARLAILLTPTALWLILKSRVSGILPTGAEYQPLRIRALMSLEAIGRYPTMILDWLRPRAEIGVMGKPSMPFAFAGIIVLLASVIVLVLYWRRMRRLQRALLAGALSSLLPVLHIVQLTIAVNAADRFLYIPLALLALLCATCQPLIGRKVPQVVLLVVALTSVPVTVARAKSWSDPVDLWTSEYTRSGGTCETCRIELAKLEAEAGSFQTALHIQKSLFRDTVKAGAVPGLVALNTSILYLRVGEYQRAQNILSRLVQDAPWVPRFWRELASAQAANGNFTDAENSAERALALMPSYENARTAIALIRTLPKRVDQLSNPELGDAERAETLTAAGRAFEAEELWLKVLQSSTSLPELEAALAFMVNMGSSRSVRHVLTSQAHVLQSLPELAARLQLKDELHQRLLRKNPREKANED